MFLFGLAIVGIGIAGLVALKDLQEILPVNIIPISLIILGVIIFFIGFLACCGAIRESRCMLIFYALIVAILLAAHIYIAVVLFGHLNTIQDEVERWIGTAFDNSNLRPVFNVMEAAFNCCGTTGAISYISANLMLPPTCCANPTVENICLEADAFQGCGNLVGSWISTFAGAIATVLLITIIVQIVAVVFALFLSHTISNKRKGNVY